MLKIPANQVVGRFGPRVSFVVFAVVVGVALLPFSDAENAKEADHPAPNLPIATRGLPLTFEQYEDGFISRTPRYTVFLEPRQLTIGLRSVADHAKTRQASVTKSATESYVRMRLLQANPVSAPLPEDPTEAESEGRLATSVPSQAKIATEVTINAAVDLHHEMRITVFSPSVAESRRRASFPTCFAVITYSRRLRQNQLPLIGLSSATGK